MPPGHPSELPEILDRVRAGERIENLETARMRKDWRRIDVALTVSPIRDDAGTVIGASTIARDVTAHKAAERKLEESSRHFELTHDLVATCGFDGYFKRLNGAWEPTLGWSHADLLADPFIEIVHPDDRDAVAEEVANLARGGTASQFRLRAATKDGGWRWTEWSAMPDARGRPLLRQRARHHRARRGRARARARAPPARRGAADRRASAAGSSTLETGERHWSEQQFRNLGFDPDGPMPSTEQILERIHPDDRESYLAHLAGFDDLRGEFAFEYRVVLPGGRVRDDRGARAAGRRCRRRAAGSWARAATSPPSATPSGSRRTSSASSRMSCARR